jgi:hypothetical protein
VKQNILIDTIKAFIESDSTTDHDFNDLAITIFAYQYENNLPFRQFSMQQGKAPRTAKTWKDIPPVPINAFKSVLLTCSKQADDGRTFMTSGTTKKGIQGKSYHPTLKIYDQSMIKNFKNRFMKEKDTIEMGILFPDEKIMPNSSLAHYLTLALKHFGTKSSGFRLNQNGINFEKIFEDLDCSQANRTPYAILGASFSIVHLVDEMIKINKTYKLPLGSKILDTGGFKGKSRLLGPDEFYDQLSNVFGIPRKNCINMYGMTELSTQFYDNGNEVCPSIKTGPHWIKSRVVNPLTKDDVLKGNTGVLVHCDLAHFNIVSSILTEDLGIELDNGFLLLGRAGAEEVKGCSMAVDEFLRATQN